MKNKFLTKISVIFLLFVFLLPIATINAAGTYEYQSGLSTIYMHDLADLLTDSEEADLVEEIGERCYNISYNILFLTTNDAENKSTMVYSDDYMDALFPVGTEDNIAFVIDMDNREIYINTMGQAIAHLSDRMIENGLDRGYNKITADDYAGCLEEMAVYCLSVLNGGNGSEVTTEGVFHAIIMAMVASALWALIITAIIVVILIGRHNKANKAQVATTYMSKENYEIIDKDEIFIRSYETVQRDYYKPKSSGSSGGGGSSHRSSSGRSHGGGGRSF